MNDTVTNHHTILLRIMAHDLLAPLTAIKWQTELLEKNFKDNEKRARYLKGIADSVELGIMISKHAHVAGAVLGNTYEVDGEEKNLSEVIKRAMSDLALQYERHALTLVMNSFEDSGLCVCDVSLVQLYVWSLAKFFLSCTPPQSSVTVSGVCIKERDVAYYSCSISVAYIPDVEIVTRTLLSYHEGEGCAYDQASIFSLLVHKTGLLLHTVLRDESHLEGVTITALFPL